MHRTLPARRLLQRATWIDWGDSLHDALRTFKIIEDEVPRLHEYAQQASKFNKHAIGRHEEMERQAAWFDKQVEDENAKRQERSDRGQTLEMLQRTTTVPDTNLPTYLHAYLFALSLWFHFANW